ncbi:MAG: hypothetical protein V4447_17565 [Pseudomonadota bacterium]
MKISFSTPALTFTLVFWGLCTFSSSAFSETYKCTINGSIAYSQSPCADGVSTGANIPTGKIPSADYQEALKRNQKDEIALKKLEDTRHKDELKREKEMKTMAARNEQTTRRCAALRTNEKWAKEDLANASLKSEKKARIKLNRASEKTELGCKAS